MRWIHFDERDPIEAAEHRAYLARIETWWNAFAKKADALDAHFSRRGPIWDLPAWMNEHLSAIHPALAWEYGRALHINGHRLVITPETLKHLRPMVRSIVNGAPSIPGWEFYDYRPVESIQAAEQIAKVRAQSDLTGVLASASVGKHNRIDVTFYFPDQGSFSEQRGCEAGFVTAETLLGEQTLDEWIGRVHAKVLPARSRVSRLMGWTGPPPPDTFPLTSFRASVLELIDSIRHKLRPEPWHKHIPVPTGPNEPIGYTFSRKPEPAADYPGGADIAIASASDHDLWMAMHTDPGFYSARYSRHGETFCCLKMDGAEKTFQARFDVRCEVERALVDLLPDQHAGAITGGATGLRYGYIDLALADVAKAWQLIRERLRNANVPRRSWLLFYDRTLAQEWIGVYDDSPTPPGMEHP